MLLLVGAARSALLAAVASGAMEHRDAEGDVAVRFFAVLGAVALWASLAFLFLVTYPRTRLVGWLGCSLLAAGDLFVLVGLWGLAWDRLSLQAGVLSVLLLVAAAALAAAWWRDDAIKGRRHPWSWRPRRRP